MANLIKKENNQATFTFTIDKDAFKKAINEAYQKTRSKYKIPGFRAGKAPKKIIETYYGTGVFYNDALNIVLPEIYDKAVEELDLKPVAQADIDIKKFEDDSDIEIEAKVFVEPEFELNDYKNLNVEVEAEEITDDKVEAYLNEEANKNARLISVEREAKLGDVAIIDFKGFVDDEAFEGGDAQNYNLELGSHSFIDNFEEQIVGMKSGEEKDIFVKFPEDYHSKSLAGKDAKFEIKLHEVKEKELPKIDDDFAKDVSEFDTIEEFKNSIKENMKKTADSKFENKCREKVIEVITDKVEIDIPEVMIENETEMMLREFDYKLRYQGLSLQQYLQFSNLYADDLKEKMKEDAKKRVKTALILNKIVEIENLFATEEEIDEEIKSIANTQRLDFEKVKEVYARNEFADIKDSIENRKAIDFLANNTKFEKISK